MNAEHFERHRTIIQATGMVHNYLTMTFCSQGGMVALLFCFLDTASFLDAIKDFNSLLRCVTSCFYLNVS